MSEGDGMAISDAVAHPGRLPAHMRVRRAERRWMARLAFALLVLGGSFISLAGVFDEQVARNIATIWPLLALTFGCYAAIVCTYFGVGAAENMTVQNLIGLARGVL